MAKGTYEFLKPLRETYAPSGISRKQFLLNGPTAPTVDVGLANVAVGSAPTFAGVESGRGVAVGVQLAAVAIADAPDASRSPPERR